MLKKSGNETESTSGWGNSEFPSANIAAIVIAIAILLDGSDDIITQAIGIAGIVFVNCKDSFFSIKFI